MKTSNIHSKLAERRFRSRRVYLRLLLSNWPVVTSTAAKFDESDMNVLRIAYDAIPIAVLQEIHDGIQFTQCLATHVAAHRLRGTAHFRLHAARKAAGLPSAEGAGLQIILEALRAVPNYGSGVDTGAWWYPIRLVPALARS